MINLKQVKENKLYVGKHNTWKTLTNRESLTGTFLPEHIRYFRLCPIIGEFGTRMIDVDYGCGWLITNAEGKECGFYSRPIDYKPSLKCKDYPLLTKEELKECVANYVAHHPYAVKHIPTGIIESEKDIELFMEAFNSYAKAKLDSMSAQEEKKPFISEVKEKRKLIEETINKVLADQQSLQETLN